MSKKKIIYILIIITLFFIFFISIIVISKSNLYFRSQINSIGIEKEELNIAKQKCHLKAYGDPQKGIYVEIGKADDMSYEELQQQIYYNCLDFEMAKLRLK